MKNYLIFWKKVFLCLIQGSMDYYQWVAFLVSLVLVGLFFYIGQLNSGLIVTNMTDEVSWGAYIANFTFLVGVAAAAILLVVPSYVFENKDVKEVVLLGELLAVAAIIMCLLFIMVDLGRPDRFLHIVPFIGRLNFPTSVLAWDVIVISGYLLLNLHIPGYLLYKLYQSKKPTAAYYRPFVYLSIFWAISIHTVTAFLYSGFGSRPYWNTAILAPRFLISAFASGPAILILAFTVINAKTNFKVKSSVFTYLRKTILYVLPINLFLLGCEVFKEFYTDSLHVASAQYLFFGLHGHSLLTPYIWTAIIMEVLAVFLVAVPRFYQSQIQSQKFLLTACVFTVLGVWIEKGMGLIIPGFVPAPLGEIVEYTPSITEFFVSLGIWALGTLLFTMMAKVAIAVLTARLAKS